MRHQFVEFLRIISAFGIVWFHVHAPGEWIAYAGLSVFLVLSAFFEARRPNHLGVGALARKLLWPWLVFMLVFGLKNAALGNPLFASNNLVAGVFCGTSPHLWFLPFMFLALVMLVAADAVLPRRTVASLAAYTLLALVMTMHLWSGWAASVGAPVSNYMYALIPVLFGISLAGVWAKDTRNIVVLPLFLSVCGIVSSATSPGYTIGLLAVVAALLVPASSVQRLDLTWLSSAMYGVYLIHPLILSALKPMHDAGLLVPTVVTCFALSALAAVAFRRAKELVWNARLGAGEIPLSRQ